MWQLWYRVCKIVCKIITIWNRKKRTNKLWPQFIRDYGGKLNGLFFFVLLDNILQKPMNYFWNNRKLSDAVGLWVCFDELHDDYIQLAHMLIKIWETLIGIKFLCLKNTYIWLNSYYVMSYH